MQVTYLRIYKGGFLESQPGRAKTDCIRPAETASNRLTGYGDGGGVADRSRQPRHRHMCEIGIHRSYLRYPWLLSEIGIHRSYLRYPSLLSEIGIHRSYLR
jgi:hypothetical protein